MKESLHEEENEEEEDQKETHVVVFAV